MALTNADREWLEGRFSKSEERFDARCLRMEDALEGLKTEFFNQNVRLEQHLSAPCRSIKDHEEKRLIHNPIKFWGLLSSVVTVISIIVSFLWKHLTGSLK